MYKFVGKSLAALLVLALGTLLFWQPVLAQKTKGKTRPAPTKVLMRCVNQPHCAAIGKLLKDTGPASAKDWETVTLHATVLNEMGYVLMDDGRCPDKVWAGATKTLREGTAKLTGCAEAKDLAGSKDAFKIVTSACAACHKTHKS